MIYLAIGIVGFLCILNCYLYGIQKLFWKFMYFITLRWLLVYIYNIRHKVQDYIEKKPEDDEVLAHNKIENAKEVEIQDDELFFDQHVVDDESESEDSISKIIMSRPFIKNLKFKLRRAKQNIVYYFRKNELDHEEIFQDPDRKEEVEVFGNQERLHPNSM